MVHDIVNSDETCEKCFEINMLVAWTCKIGVRCQQWSSAKFVANNCIFCLTQKSWSLFGLVTKSVWFEWAHHMLCGQSAQKSIQRNFHASMLLVSASQTSDHEDLPVNWCHWISFICFCQMQLPQWQHADVLLFITERLCTWAVLAQKRTWLHNL